MTPRPFEQSVTRTLAAALCGPALCGAVASFAIAAASLAPAPAPATTPRIEGPLLADAGAILSPLRADESRLASASERASHAAVPLIFDEAAYAELRDHRDIVIADFPLAPLARGHAMQRISLELTRSNTLTEKSNVVLAHVIDGRIIEHPLESPDVQLFRGRVAGDDASYAFIAFSPHGTHGYIRTQGVTQLISPGPFGEGRTPLIYNLEAIPRGLIQWRDFICDAQTPDGLPWPAPHVPGEGGIAGPVFGSEPPCRRVEVAIETDKEFTDAVFSGSESAASAYVAAVIGAASEIFTRDVNVELEITFVRLWTGSDPWSGGTTTQQLFEFRDYWNANMTHIDRHLAHYLSGRELGGGVAWLNAVCHPNHGYALSANISGFFPYPLQNNHSQNWDVLVVTHEFGHNFGTPHTHNFCPPLDQCPPEQFFGQCQNEQVCVSAGTIMGYCHLCDGGLGNVMLEFHPVVKQTMLDYLDTVTNCYIGCVRPSDVIHVPADAPTIQEAINAVIPGVGGEVIVAPGIYNEAINFHGKPVHVRSTGGPEVTVINAATSGGASAVRFSNGENFQAVIEGFTLTGGTGSNVTIAGNAHLLGGGIYAAGASPTIINCIITGNSADFGGGIFNNNASPTIQNCIIADNVAAPSSGGGMFNFNGAAPQIIDTLFEGNFAQANGGAMSNQSSFPSVLNARFIGNSAGDNGGAIRNISSSAGQFTDCTFESNVAVSGVGGAFFNEGSSGTTVADSLFCENAPNNISGSHTDAGGNTFEAECPFIGDLNGDGLVDIFDLLILLAAWGPCPDGELGAGDGCPADLNGDGVVNVHDLLILLANWD